MPPLPRSCSSVPGPPGSARLGSLRGGQWLLKDRALLSPLFGYCSCGKNSAAHSGNTILATNVAVSFLSFPIYVVV